MKYRTSLAFTASVSCESELICFTWSACSLDSNAPFDFSMATATNSACLDCSLVALLHSSSKVWGLSSWSSLTECVQLILKICNAKSQFNELFISALLDFAPACLLGRLGFHLVFKSPVRSGFLAPKQRNRTRTGPRKVPRAGNQQLVQ